MPNMSEMLSQAEIDALLGDPEDSEDTNPIGEEKKGTGTEFTEEEKDALGEIGNISMGTSATTLSTLLSHKVLITTPAVSITDWQGLAHKYPIPYVAIKVAYMHGLEGNNLLILAEEDTKVIADLMMGGLGKPTEGPLQEIHLSAIAEAMNQMVGSAATSMSSIFDKRIDISPPEVFMINFKADIPFGDFKLEDKVVRIAFRMVIEDLIDSEIMLLLPPYFAKAMVNNLLQMGEGESLSIYEEQDEEQDEKTKQSLQQDGGIFKDIETKYDNQTILSQENTQEEITHDNETIKDSNTKRRENEDGGIPMAIENSNKTNKVQKQIQPVEFKPFENETTTVNKENISLIMDVPLEITAELGKTKRLIKEILEFSAGSIIELDKLAGEPINILVNGKVIANGEVVVIDDNFGIRITDIVNPSKRL